MCLRYSSPEASIGEQSYGLMPAAETAAAPDAVSKSVQGYLEVCLFCLTLTGFATLAATGALHLAAVAPVSLALLVRGWLLATRRNLLVSEGSTTMLTLACALFYGADLFLLRSGFLPATVRLVLFLMIIRLFSARKDRDHYFLAVIAFLMVLSAAVLTVNSTFLLGFAMFLLAATATFILMEMKNAAGHSTVRGNFPERLGDHKLLGRSLLTAAAVLVVTSLLGGLGIFFLLPRTSAGYLSAYTPATEIATGFSDSVQLGRIGMIQQSSAPVMHIQIEDDRSGSSELKWRGVTLSNFDGRNWSRPYGQRILARGENGFLLPASGLSQQPRLVRYRVMMETIGANVFFLAPQPRSLTGDYRLIAIDSGEGVTNVDADHTVGRYEAVSDVFSPSLSALRSAKTEYPYSLATQYLQLPRLDARIPALAQEITRSAGSSLDKALQLENYLRTHFGYTLQLSRHTPPDPLAEFLFERKQGHCEYFASSMAVMLRSLGIPSRVVNGFKGGEFNDVSAEYVVRASDAHSWVEAYFPPYGWISFDPTPFGPGVSHGRWNRAWLYADAMQEFWREWVINYDIHHQQTVAAGAQASGERLLRAVRHSYKTHYGELLAVARRTEGRALQSPGRWAATAFAGLVLLLISLNFRRIRQFGLRLRLLAGPQTTATHAASLWYERALKRVAQRGVKKAAGETPQEFLSRIQDDKLRGKVTRFILHYERARFGNSLPDAQQLPALYQAIRSESRKRDRETEPEPVSK